MQLEIKIDAKTRLQVQQGDITQLAVDAIVNAANQMMLGGGGVDGAIHAQAGPQLLEACKAVPEVAPNVRCPAGQARITPAFQLPAKYVIHTVGPIFADTETSQPLLQAAYKSSLRLANESSIVSIAFPAISCGVFGYPHEEASIVAFDQCLRKFGSIARIHFVLFDQSSFEIWRNVFLRRAKETGIL